jgi:glycosyltransferase involved in cell wall biosynthesis
MRILLPVVSFHYLTGSELYVYETARELIRRGHDTTVASFRVGGALAGTAKAAGIPAYEFGDARVCGGTFDIIHASEPDPTGWALRTHPDTPIICTVHSQYECERPIKDPRIRRYICIRPEVQRKIVDVDGIPEAQTSVIFNPVDMTRFKPEQEAPRQGKRILFCGTVDLLRKATIFDLFRRTGNEGFELWLLGLKADCYSAAGSYIDRLPPGVKWFDQDWNTEQYIHQCDETAGILLGRTTIESWACGKPSWIYAIDLQGNILSRELHQPPVDMSPFDSVNVVNQFEALYRQFKRRG